MSKTIKQVADELGVSKTAIRKKIEKLGLRYSLQKNGNQLLIPETTESALKRAFEYAKTETRKLKTEDYIANEKAFLKEELRQKNEQISSLMEEQKRLLQIIDDNNQHLASMEEMLKAEIFLKVQAEKKVLALEEKIEDNTNNLTWFEKLAQKWK